MDDAAAQQAAREVQIMQAARHDLREFAAIYDRYFPRIYAYCLRRVNSAQEAEDLTSQIFTRAMVNIDQYRGGFVAAWLFRIAHNVVYSYGAIKHPQISLEELSAEIEAETINPIENVVQAEEVRFLEQLFAQLPSDQQQLLRLKIVEGLSSEKISSIVGKTAGSVRVTLHRIFRRLYSEYEKREGGSLRE